MSNTKEGFQRRTFLGRIAAGAASVGLLSIPKSIKAIPEAFTQKAFTDDDPDAWFNGVKGKHRMVFDVISPNGTFPFAWPKAFIMTNEKTGSPASDVGVVVVFRHEAIPYAFNDDLWKKYDFGKNFKVNAPQTGQVATHNIFWKPSSKDFIIPGIGEVALGINDLQAQGVMFCVCDVAITIHTAVMAMQMKKDAAELKKEWLANLLPGIQVVPSGVWAVGRAQEHDCKYCYVG